ncbi:MAG: tRNA pseudouridine(38-40) synthase TruA [Parachlamydiaceae bacterium]|nr:tRNA pseudouridine(38-40) synthase TruA [Parachlamydiaceae bacterium]
MHCYKLTIAYDGSDFNGWQIQPNGRSIQELIENALKIITNNETIKIIGSGRTDAGVHAQGQTAHFKIDSQINLSRTLFSLNGLLPPTIRILKIEEVSLDFHARYSAIGKEYHYHLYPNSILNPFLRLYTWHLKRKIDVNLLKEAARLFVGTHDFTSFSNESHRGSAAKNPVRTVYRIDVVESEEGIRIEFEGNGFLYKMVRNIVGLLIEVAANKKEIHDIQTIFEARDRRKSSQTAPPQGLFLMRVIY